MAESSRRNRIIAVIVAIIILLLLLIQCRRPKPVPVAPANPAPAAIQTPGVAQPSTPAPGTKEPDEILTPATVQAPPQVAAGAGFTVTWTGPANVRDYLTLVRKDAPDDTYAAYVVLKDKAPAQMTAPVDPGDWEVRYVAARSRTVLGRAPVIVLAVGATLDAAASVTIDSPVSVVWTGPANEGDYITLVAATAPDGHHGNYTLVRQGSPLTVTAPLEAGEGELRYMTGQGAKVLGRRAVRLVLPEVRLDAPARAVAGSPVAVTWTGPANQGDYLTVVDPKAPEGKFTNYTLVRLGSPLDVTMTMEPGAAELRYMTGRGGKVLGRRAITIVAAEITLDAPTEAAAGSPISVAWTGPANQGDYITIVARDAADGKFGHYTNAGKKTPVTVNAPKETGPAEIRYMSGQGAKVLARRLITVTP